MLDTDASAISVGRFFGKCKKVRSDILWFQEAEHRTATVLHDMSRTPSSVGAHEGVSPLPVAERVHHHFKKQLGCRFDITDNKSYFLCFDICNYICLDTSDHFSVLPS